MSVADRLNKLTTDITNAYTSIDNKGGTIPSDKNTDNLHTAIDSIEVIEQATAEGESLNLTNTKAMPYSDYVVEGKSEQEGTPSPINPSEIHSVADDVNLFDKANYTIIDGVLGFDISNLEIGKQYTFSSNLPITCFKISDYSSGYNSVSNYDDNGFTNFTFTMARNSNIPSSATQYLFIALNLFNFITDINDITNYNIKVQKGSTSTPYSPYNQGTVTIKQENIKNYLNWDKFIDYSNWTNSNSPGYKSFEITGLNINKTYTLCRTDTAGYGETSKYAGFNKGNNNGNMFLYSTDSSRNLQSVSDISSEDGKIYITMYMSSQSDLNDYIAIIKKCWVIEGTDYEPYQSNDYTIQTEPLRSLPNGVKDTIEEDGIHRRAGRIVLDGSESGWYKQDNTSYSEDYLRFTIGITDKKNASNPNSKKDNILSNNFTNKILDNNSTRKTNSITGQFSTNLINIFVAQNIINESRVDDFKTWLSTHNTEIIYELAEEIIEPLTQNQATTMLDIIKTGSYEGTTNIYTDEDVKPTMKVDYYKKG